MINLEQLKRIEQLCNILPCKKCGVKHGVRLSAAGDAVFYGFPDDVCPEYKEQVSKLIEVNALSLQMPLLP